MIPFFAQPILQLGPIAIHAFGVAVAIAMLVGTRAAERLFERRGLDRAIGTRLATWVLVGGLTGAHLFAVFFYKPHKLLDDPWLMLRFWEDISSFGGMLGGIAGAFLFFQSSAGSAARAQRWDYLGSIAQVFSVSLAIGRRGVNIKLACELTGYEIDVYRDNEGEVEEFDIDLEEFSDEIEGWVIDSLKAIGCDTARSVLALSSEELERRADLEKETIAEVRKVLQAEFEKE